MIALVIGRVGPRKNITGLIEGIKEWLKTNGYYLSVVGPGEKSQLTREEVTYTGYISEAEKQKLLERAGLLFETSFFEGIGIPVLEGIGLGQVVSHTTSLPEYAPTQAILLNPYDLAEYPQACVAAIWDLKQNVVK